MPRGNDEPPISDRLHELLVKHGFKCFPNAWVQAHAVAAPTPANDDEAAKGHAAAPPKAASAAAHDPDDKCTRDADYRAKERAEDGRRGIAQCVLRLPRPLHPPLQALAAEAREPGGSRSVVAMAALGLRPEWKEIVYDVERQADAEALLTLIARIVTNPALCRIVRILAAGAADREVEEADDLEDLIEALLLQPTLRTLLFALVRTPQLQTLCSLLAADVQAAALAERLHAHCDRRFVEAAMRLEQDDRALIRTILNLDGRAKRALLIATQRPQLLEALVQAADNPAVENGIRIAVANPKAALIGQVALQATGLLGWIAKTAIARIARKAAPG
jgi:hypothetical protein